MRCISAKHSSTAEADREQASGYLRLASAGFATDGKNRPVDRGVRGFRRLARPFTKKDDCRQCDESSMVANMPPPRQPRRGAKNRLQSLDRTFTQGPRSAKTSPPRPCKPETPRSHSFACDSTLWSTRAWGLLSLALHACTIARPAGIPLFACVSSWCRPARQWTGLRKWGEMAMGAIRPAFGFSSNRRRALGLEYPTETAIGHPAACECFS